MDYKQIINKHRAILIHDLHGDVIELFKHSRYITDSEFHRLKAIKMRTDRNEQFVDYIYERIDKSMHENLVKMLEVDYWWLANRLRLPTRIGGSKLFKEPNQRLKTTQDMVEEALIEGCVPNILYLSLHVERNKMVKKLRDKFRVLKPGEFLVLHGMVGSGKSCLAASALNNNDIIFEVFNGRIFWLKNVDDIRGLQQNLFDQLVTITGKYSSAVDSEDLCEDTNDATRQLKKMMRDCFNGINRGLVIVDDINEFDASACISFLDELKCKTLIITENADVVNENLFSCTLMKVDDFLTPDELYKLFAKAADIQVKDLFLEEVNQIHKLVNGFPMILFMLANEVKANKEDAKRNVKWWQDIVKAFSEKDIDSSNKRQSARFKDPLDAVIQLKFENMPDNLINLYKYFAVFEKNVNLMPEVLMTLWNERKETVESTMKTFESKSLATRVWNEHLNCYVYGIHNLLLDSLKKRFAGEIQDLHVTLINNYSLKCNGEFWRLKNDNYIFLYLGYHFEKAGCSHIFPDTFLNLDFVNSKIKAVGLRDMRRDLIKYKNRIAIEETDERMLSDLLTFVNNFGSTIHHAKDIDIVQLGLQQSPSSLVHKAAIDLVYKRNSEMSSAFIKFLYSPVTNAKSIGLRGDETIACFADTQTDVMIGTISGDIKRRLVKGNTVKKILRGHTSQINFFNFSPGRRLYLLSVATDSSGGNGDAKKVHEIRVWDLVDTDQKVNGSNIYPGSNDSSDGDRSPSPGRQDSYCMMWPSAGENIQSCIRCFEAHTDTIYCAQFSPHLDKVVSCSKDRDIREWSIRGFGHSSWTCGSVPLFCMYSWDGTLIFVAQENNNISIFSSSLHHRLETVLQVPKSVVAMYSTYGTQSIQGVYGCHDLVVVMDELVHVIRYEPSSVRNIAGNSRNVDEKKILTSWMWESSLNEKEEYKCKSCFNREFSFIALTTSCHNVCVYKLEDGEIFKKYETNGEVMSLDTIKGEDGNPLLMATCKDKSVFVWKIVDSPIKPNFSCLPVWKNDEPIIAVPGNSNCQIMSGREVINTLEMVYTGEVASVCHILNDTIVVIGTNIGNVWLYKMKTGKGTNRQLVMEFDPPEVTDSSGNGSIGNRKRSSLSNCDVVFVRVYDADGKYLIVAIDSNNVIKVSYDCEVYSYIASTKVVGCFFDPKSNQIVTIQNNSGIKIWSTDLKLEKYTPEEVNNVTVQACDMCTNLGCSPFIVMIANEKKFIFLTNLTDLIKNIDNPKLASLQTTSQPTCCSFSPDGKQLAVGFVDGILNIYYTENIKGNFHSIQLGVCSIKAVCLGPDLLFGALGRNRIYLGDSRVIATAQLSAEQICKDENSDKFVTVDNEGNVQVISFYPLKNYVASLISLRSEPTHRFKQKKKKNPSI